MKGIFLEGKSPLCEALRGELRKQGELLSLSAAESDRLLFFPSPEEDFLSRITPLLDQMQAGVVLVALPYFLWEGDPADPRGSAFAGAAEAAVRALARGYAPRICLNCVRLGYVEGEQIPSEALEQVALGRPARVEELGQIIRFFLNEGSSFMTGQTIDANGGRIY